MKRTKYLLAMAAVIVGAALLSSCAGFGAQSQFKAHLAAAQGAQSSAQGDATFQLSADGSSMTYTLSVTNLMNVTMAHIHISTAPGQPGDVAVWLYPPKAPPALKAGTFSGVLQQGTFTAADFQGPLANLTMADLVDRIKKGLAYVNVHTNQYPGGEIQGTISAAGMAGGGSGGPMSGGRAY